MRALTVPLLAVCIAVAACSDDPEPIAYSDTIALRLSGIKEDDIRADEASEEKNVNTETGNPYAEFLRAARAALDGHDPSAIAVTGATLRIHEESRGVTAFAEVFQTLELFISTNETTIPVGLASPLTSTSAPVTISADAADLDAVQPDLLGGDFKVGVRGPTVPSPPADFDLKTSIEIVFEALP